MVILTLASSRLCGLGVSAAPEMSRLRLAAKGVPRDFWTSRLQYCTRAETSDIAGAWGGTGRLGSDIAMCCDAWPQIYPGRGNGRGGKNAPRPHATRDIFPWYRKQSATAAQMMDRWWRRGSYLKLMQPNSGERNQNEISRRYSSCNIVQLT